MAATKTARSLYASTLIAASGSADATEWNLSTAYGGLLTIVLTNGGSAPTTAPVVTVYTGDATGVKRQYWSASGDTVASSVNTFNINLPPSAMFVNVHIAAGATNGTTAVVEGQELTSV